MEEEQFYTKGSIIKKLYRLAYIFHDIMINNNIIYYACSGTLLGTMRHKGIIPWDNDLDFCIPLTNKERFLSDKVKKIFKKYGYKVSESVNGWHRIDGKDKESADIFFVEMVKDSKTNENVIQHTGKALKFWPKEKILLKDLFPLKERQFGSGIILTPNSPKNSLCSFYGKDWNKIGYITMDPAEHLELDEPIKLKVKTFHPAKPLYNRKQIHLDRNEPYMNGIVL